MSCIERAIIRVDFDPFGNDAIRLYGGNAIWKDVGQRLLDDTCRQRTGRLEEDGCWPAFNVTWPAFSFGLHLDVRMAPKYRPTPLSGDRKALTKELGKARAMTGILAGRSAEMRTKGEAMIQQADKLLCESWNERMWSDGEPIDPSPTVDQAINGGFPWLEIQCARCKTPSDVDLAALKHPPRTFVHDLASRLRCLKCAKTGRRPSATLLQLGWQPRHSQANV